MEKIGASSYYFKINKNSVSFVDAKTGQWVVSSKKNCLNLGIESKEIIDNLEYIEKYLRENIFLNINQNIEKPCIDKFNLFIVDTTNICNLRCDYCSVNANDQGKFLNFTTAVKGFEKFLQLNNISDVLTIEFSGGEPLLNFNAIKNIVYYYKQLAKNIRLNYALQFKQTQSC